MPKKNEYIWMKVSQDKFELPIEVADSSTELAEKCNVDPTTIFKSIQRNGEKSIYKKIRMGQSKGGYGMTVTLIGASVPFQNGRPRQDGMAMDTVETAAAICYKSKPTWNHLISMKCASSGHMSVFEHTYFTFKVQGLSRATLQQLTRHRMFSFSVKSQRYCSEEGFEYVTPNSVKWNMRGKEVLEDGMAEAELAYTTLVNMGIPKEDARAVLPNACTTELIISGNGRAYIEASHLRLCMRAQAEIRRLFDLMRKEIFDVAPEVGLQMVPQCETEEICYCREEKTCGKHKRLKDILVKIEEMEREAEEDGD